MSIMKGAGMRPVFRPAAIFRAGFVAIAALGLASCVSLGGAEPPPSLLTLTSDDALSSGVSIQSATKSAIRIFELETPAKININRVPVQVDATEIAYLKDAIWVDKPARLFRSLVAETIRARTSSFVIDGDDPGLKADGNLRGVIREFGYDARNGSAIIRFDAVWTVGDGTTYTQRFESVQPGVVAEAGPVADALNDAANDVAGQLVSWITGAGGAE